MTRLEIARQTGVMILSPEQAKKLAYVLDQLSSGRLILAGSNSPEAYDAIEDIEAGWDG